MSVRDDLIKRANPADRAFMLAVAECGLQCRGDGTTPAAITALVMSSGLACARLMAVSAMLGDAISRLKQLDPELRLKILATLQKLEDPGSLERMMNGESEPAKQGKNSSESVN